MELNDIKELKNIKLISSTESNCYVYKDIIYKVFKNSLIDDRLDIIKFFLENDIQHCPKLYNLVYDNNEIIGYSMQYYKKAMPVSEINRFNLLKEKCLELINVYLSLKDDNSLCYIDFNRGNVFVNNNKILLLDIDSCLKRTLENEQVSKQILKEFVLGIIYKTSFFDYETYFTSIEREQIRNILYKNIDGENIDSIADLRKFIADVSKNDVKKILKRIHYKIR